MEMNYFLMKNLLKIKIKKLINLPGQYYIADFSLGNNPALLYAEATNSEQKNALFLSFSYY